MEVTKEVALLAEALVHGEKEDSNLLIGTIYIRSNHFLIVKPYQPKNHTPVRAMCKLV